MWGWGNALNWANPSLPGVGRPQAAHFQSSVPGTRKQKVLEQDPLPALLDGAPLCLSLCVWPEVLSLVVCPGQLVGPLISLFLFSCG